MTDEPKYVSTHDIVKEKAAIEFAKTMSGKTIQPINTQQQAKTTELEDIRRSQKYILDKLSTMDRFLRGDKFRYGHKIYDGEAYKEQIIREFLQDMRAGKYTDNDLKLLEQNCLRIKDE
jgi:hypothetical protein